MSGGTDELASWLQSDGEDVLAVMMRRVSSDGLVASALRRIGIAEDASDADAAVAVVTLGSERDLYETERVAYACLASALGAGDLAIARDSALWIVSPICAHKRSSLATECVNRRVALPVGDITFDPAVYAAIHGMHSHSSVRECVRATDIETGAAIVEWAGVQHFSSVLQRMTWICLGESLRVGDAESAREDALWVIDQKFALERANRRIEAKR